MLGDRDKLEEARELEVKGAGVEQRLDRFQQAFDAEQTGSMSLNIRGTALAASSALAIILLAQFSATWLDDNRWQIPGELLGLISWFDVQKGLLYVSIAALLLTILAAIAVAWPSRPADALSKQRLASLSEGEDRAEAEQLLAMAEAQRAQNAKKARRLRWSVVPASFAVLAAAGQGVVFAWKAQTVDPLRAGAASTAEQLADIGLTAEDQAELAERYAPRVILNRDEPYPPMNPLSFIRQSRLVWNRDRTDIEVAARGEVDPERLGRECSDSPSGCYTGPTGFLSRELTRPSTDKQRGFALDFGGSTEAGEPGGPSSVPMWWEMRLTPDELLVTYWFFYGYSRLHLQKSGRGKGADIVLNRASHEGDWENIDVALSLEEHDPLAVYFYGHGDPKRREWVAICKLVDGAEDCQSNSPGHPIVYSALKTHASYPTPAPPEPLGCKLVICAFDLRDADGVVWETWDLEEGLLPAVEQPWYGFGGAWGGVSDGAEPGPLGPSAWKLPADPDPSASAAVPQ